MIVCTSTCTCSIVTWIFYGHAHYHCSGPVGPGEVCPIPATEFFAALKATCPGVPVSLGWRTARGFRDVYTAQDFRRLYGPSRMGASDVCFPFFADSLSATKCTTLLFRAGQAPKAATAIVRLCCRAQSLSDKLGFCIHSHMSVPFQRDSSVLEENTPYT